MSDKLKHVAPCLYRSTTSGRYYGIVGLNGKQLKKSLHTTERTTADHRLTRMKANLRGFNGESAGVAFGAWCVRWLSVKRPFLADATRKRYETIIGMLDESFECKLREMTAERLTDWATKRLADVAPRTYNIERDVLERILQMATDQGAIISNPAVNLPRAKVTEKLDVLPTLDQLTALLAAIRADATHAPHADLIEFLAWSGCRIGEAERIRWVDVNLTDGITVDGKTGPRILPMFEPLRALLTRLAADQTGVPLTELVFPTGRRIEQALKFGCERIGFNAHLTNHSFRKWFCSYALNTAKLPVGVVAKIIGHHDGGALLLKTYQRVGADDLKNALQKIGVAS